jgi:hypothetical protein
MAKLTEGVRLLTWGDPLLEAWLGAIRGTPLTDADYKVSGVARDDDSDAINAGVARVDQRLERLVTFAFGRPINNACPVCPKS